MYMAVTPRVKSNIKQSSSVKCTAQQSPPCPCKCINKISVSQDKNRNYFSKLGSKDSVEFIMTVTILLSLCVLLVPAWV